MKQYEIMNRKRAEQLQAESLNKAFPNGFEIGQINIYHYQTPLGKWKEKEVFIREKCIRESYKNWVRMDKY
jgi:hypothetical protein